MKAVLLGFACALLAPEAKRSSLAQKGGPVVRHEKVAGGGYPKHDTESYKRLLYSEARLHKPAPQVSRLGALQEGPAVVTHEKEAGEGYPEGYKPEDAEPEEGVKEHEESHHRTVCVLFLLTMLVIPVFAEFALHPGPLGKYTFQLMDTFISVFIAVMWFQAFDKLMHFHGFESHHKIASAALHIVFLFGLANTLAWALRDSKVKLAALITCGSHYVGFAAVHTAGHLQIAYFDSLATSPLLLLTLVTVLTLLAWLMHQARSLLPFKSPKAADEFEESAGDLENDVMALTLSYIISQTVKFALSGEVQHFAQTEELFLQREEEEEESHTGLQRGIMAGYAFAMLGASLLLPAKKEGFAGKLLDIAKTTCVMCGAWGFLLALDWEFYENLFPPETEETEMFSAVIFAYCVTAVAFVGLLAMHLVKVPPTSELARVFPLALGLAAAWSWEEAFDKAIDILAESYSLTPDSDGLFLKVGIAVVTPLCFLPMYLRHVKPRCID